MKVYMKKTVTSKTSDKQNLKSYGSIKLTVYGKMIKLTAGGSCGQSESGAPGIKLGNTNRC